MSKPIEDKSPNSQTADPAESAEQSGHASLTRVVFVPAHETSPPRGQVPSPVDPPAHPEENLPDDSRVTLSVAMLTVLFVAHPHRSVEAVPSVLEQLRNIATYSWLNVLLVFIPISWATVSDFPLNLLVG